MVQREGGPEGVWWFGNKRATSVGLKVSRRRPGEEVTVRLGWASRFGFLEMAGLR